MTETLTKNVDLRVPRTERLRSSPKALAWLLAMVAVALPVTYSMLHLFSASGAKAAAGLFALASVGTWGWVQLSALKLWWRAKRRLLWLPLTVFITGAAAQTLLAIVWFALSFELDLNLGPSEGYFFGWTGC